MTLYYFIVFSDVFESEADLSLSWHFFPVQREVEAMWGIQFHVVSIHREHKIHTCFSRYEAKLIRYICVFSKFQRSYAITRTCFPSLSCSQSKNTSVFCLHVHITPSKHMCSKCVLFVFIFVFRSFSSNYIIHMRLADLPPNTDNTYVFWASDCWNMV
jgi:hypothetical protein